MHPGFGIPGIQQQQQQQQQQQMNNNNNNMMETHHHHHHHHHQNGTTSMNQTHNNIIADQEIHHNLFMDHHNNTNTHHQQQQNPFLPVSQHYMTADYPVNFKLGLNEINCTSSNAGDGVGGSNQHYQLVPEEARHTSLEMHNQHCWPQDSSSIIKQTQQLWEPIIPSEVSNENSEIIDRLEKNITTMNKKQTCSNSKVASEVYGGELEAIYKRCGTTTVNQTPADCVLPRGQDHQVSDEASIDASVCLKDEDNKKKMKKKKRKGRASYNELVQFFEKLVKQVVDHQETLHTKFVERMERLDAERREKEEAWRSRELVYFEQQAAARAREKALAATREDAIVSYFEKITGQTIPNLPSFNPNS